jgi:hypothetical protein
MSIKFHPSNQIITVSNFQDLISTPFRGEVNAICWERVLKGDFAEIVEKIHIHGNVTEIEPDDLRKLQLSEQGHLAREIIINDIQLLKDNGASPSLNVIKYYERDEELPYFSTDVYSFHIDRATIPTDTILCTYYGDCSEIVPNDEATQKVLIPEIRNELKKLYDGAEDGFESFLTEHFFDLHYELKANVNPINLGIGNLWRLAIDHPESQVPPCIHRAPYEKPGKARLLLIC